MQGCFWALEKILRNRNGQYNNINPLQRAHTVKYVAQNRGPVPSPHAQARLFMRFCGRICMGLKVSVVKYFGVASPHTPMLEPSHPRWDGGYLSGVYVGNGMCVCVNWEVGKYFPYFT